MTLIALWRRPPARSPRRRVTDARIRALEAARFQAQRRWALLFSDPDVWGDREKRRMMLDARIAYQEATLDLVEACSDGAGMRERMSAPSPGTFSTAPSGPKVVAGRPHADRSEGK
jgi:hypothetical protein